MARFRSYPRVFLSGWCLTLLALAPPAAAQEEAGDVAAFAEAVDVRVVNVEAFVTDRSGTPVAGLEKDDFELYVNGERVEITNFYSQSSGPRGSVEAPVGANLEPREDSSFFPEEAADAAGGQRLYLTVFVDHSRLRASNRKRAFTAVRKLVNERLRPEDLVTVVSFGNSMVFHADFLYDRGAIDRVLADSMRTSARADLQSLERRQIIGELSRGQSGGRLERITTDDLQARQLLTRIRAYAEDEYQRSLQSIRQLERVVATLAGLPGRKAILYVSDGIPNRPGEEIYEEWINRLGGDNPNAQAGVRRFDANSDYTRAVGNYDLLQDMVGLGERANVAGVTLYALDAESNHGADLRSALTEQGAISRSLSVVNDNLREPLELAATVTGGRRIQASGSLDDNLASLATDFGSFYSLGFSPEVWDPGASQSIEIRMRSKGLVVRHREDFGVLGPDEEAAQATVTALLYRGLENPLGISLEARDETQRDDGTRVLTVLVQIPVARLTLLPDQDSHSAQLTFFVAVKDGAGSPGAVQKVPFHLRIPNEKLEEAQARSAHYPLPVVLRSGDQQVAVGVRDEKSGVLSTVRLDVARYSASL